MNFYLSVKDANGIKFPTLTPRNEKNYHTAIQQNRTEQDGAKTAEDPIDCLGMWAEHAKFLQYYNIANMRISSQGDMILTGLAEGKTIIRIVNTYQKIQANIRHWSKHRRTFREAKWSHTSMPNQMMTDRLLRLVYQNGYSLRRKVFSLVIKGKKNRKKSKTQDG